VDGRPGELSICHGIITSLGGTITARNEGGGAVFTPTLPEAPAA
jgi:signal transduction histidine kinase